MISLVLNARYKNRPLTGVERFAFEVEKELRKRNGLQIREVNPGRELSGLKGHSWEQFVLPTQIKRSEILFSACNTGPIAVKNQFVVIHDAAVWDYPEGFSKSFGTLYRNLLPRLAKSCRQVATVSEFSRSRLAEWLKLEKDRILVLGNAAAPEFCPGKTKKVNQPLRFFCVSSLDPRKNFKQLIKAWEILQSRGSLPRGTTLRIAGGANPRNFSSVEFEESPSVTWLGRISDEDLIEEYRAATAFIFPSLYEGFGLPPLEALACGCPVLLSDRASLPEVGGPAFEPGAKGAVIYFDPEEPESIGTAIEKFLQLPPEAIRQMSENAVARSRGFSWERVTNRIVQNLELLG